MEQSIPGFITYFNGCTCDVVKMQYDNKRTALKLVDRYNGEPVAIATINVPEIQVDYDETLIKDYSENSGMLDALVRYGIVEDTGVRFKYCGLDLPLVKVLI